MNIINPKQIPNIILSRDSQVLANLPCFRCAAQYLSFTTAAIELNLTQSAVSHRIKKLEQQLGFDLFIRYNRQLELTNNGQQLLLSIDHAFTTLDSTFTDSDCLRGRLTLSAPPSVSFSWLGEALALFQQQHTQLNIQLHSHNSRALLSDEQVDLAITYGNGAHPGFHSEHLMSEQLIAVCSADYMRQKNLKNNPPGLADCLFIHDTLAQPQSGPLAEWHYWLAQNQLQYISASADLCFDMSALALAAAQRGCGVAIGRHSLIQQQLKAGDLVSPFALEIEADAAYHLVCHPQRLQHLAVKALRLHLKQFLQFD
ncbi:MAG: LysR substrate-binding domain-containing protein [Oceanospirillaceae bacterium]